MSDRPNFDTKAFLEFCRSKPVGEEYNVYDTCNCALGQFGFGDITTDSSAERAGVPVAVFDAALDYPSTFSALADRLAKLVGE